MNAAAKTLPEQMRRVCARFEGRVQGVGFRPFVWRLARQMGVAGSVRNAATGALVEAEGPAALVQEFLHEIERAAPGECRLAHEEERAASGAAAFEILESEPAGARVAMALPDLASCAKCLEELHDPANPRYRYPFIACTACGPRYSVTRALPFDRDATSMAAFPLSGLSAREYADPDDRRFHAQMVADPGCGPHVELWDVDGACIATRKDALARGCEVIREGKILALKGVGGFQLLCDARNEDAVARLRERKAREAKPFALMVAGLDAARALARVDGIEAAALTSPEAPIVLLKRREGAVLAPSLAPGLSTLGVMLPASPLHHLIAGDLGFPVVATSGNLSGEPLCIANDEALARLGKIADSFLVHNREIVRPLDDSVVRVIGARAVTLRLGRGLAPLPLGVPAPRGDALACGAHMKNAPALLSGKGIVLAQHVGDLDTESARAALVRADRDLENLFTENESGGAAACDAHPDYGSTHVAFQHSGAPLRVWHHHAHVLACMLDNETGGEVLGVSWDGTGLGPDGTLWGGEFLQVDGARFERVAHLRAFRLPGGSAAIGEPLRVAAALLHDIYGEDLPRVGPFVDKAFRKKAWLWASLPNAPVTTSAGRLFDAVAALLGLCEKNRYEGEAAMRLEGVAVGADDSAYELALASGEAIVLDWEPVIRAIVSDLEAGEGAPAISARFHGALARAIAEVATKLRAPRVALTGGCFQNRILCESAIAALRAAGIEPLWHRRVPPGDGGIAAGQALAAWYAKEG